MRGGVGDEYEISLKTGSSVLKNLSHEKYCIFDMLVTKNGEWHLNGIPTTPAKLVNQVDVVFNALHGEYGEDGKVQRILEQFKIPYTGSSVFASAIAMNKALSKYYFKKEGIKTPECLLVVGEDDVEKSARRIFRKLPAPYIVKPISAGSSVGISIAHDFDGLIKAIKNALHYNNKMVLVEEYISGREITCGVIDSMSTMEPYAISPVEIVPPEETEFFNYEAKYNETTLRVCPANLLSNTTKRIQEHAVKAHKALGMRHYSCSDFILSKRGLYILETNSLPGLTETSLLPKALETAKLELPEFLDYVITLALERK